VLLTGVIWPEGQRPITRRLLAIVWTCILPFPTLVASTIIINRIPQQLTTTTVVTLSRPGSGAFDSIRMQSSGSPGAARLAADTLIATTTNAGETYTLEVHADHDEIVEIDAQGWTTKRNGPLTREFLKAWFAAIGIEVTGAVEIEIDQILRNRPGSAPGGVSVSRFTHSSSSSGSNGVRQAAHFSAGFSSSSTTSGTTVAPRDHLWWKAGLLGVAVWLAGMLLILAKPSTRLRQGAA